MPTSNNLKALMRVEKKTIWQLADDFGVDYMLLVDVFAGKDHLDLTHQKRVSDRMIALDLCPVCGNVIRHEGGCMLCTCGWEFCG